MKISTYSSETSAIADVKVVNPDQLVALLLEHHEVENKKGSAAWSPASLRPCPTPCLQHAAAEQAKARKTKPPFDCGGGKLHRHEQNVESHACVVFDIDHVQTSVLNAVGERLTEAGIRGVIHSTYSHQATDYCVRVILLTDRDIPAADVRAVRAALVAKYDIPSDPVTKDLSRLYYLPSHPEGATPDSYFSMELEGEPLKLSSLTLTQPVKQSSIAPVQAQTTEPVEDIKALRERLTEIDTPDGKAIAKRVLEGEALAPKGQHDTSLQRLAGLLATWLPEETSFPAIVQLAELSLRRMGWEDGWDHLLQEFESKWERAVERTAAFRAQRKAAQDELARAWRLKAVATTENPLAQRATEDGFYTEEALDEWSVGEKEWVIQKADTYFIFRNGTYVARGKSELANAIGMDLARAPLDLEVETKKGSRPMTTAEIVQTYGTVADGVHSSVILQRSYFDSRTGVFHEAVRPLRPLVPQQYPEIQTWLELLGSSDKERFLDWVATVTQLDRQSCALYIHGFPGAGKTVLAHGLTRLWTKGAPADLRRVLGAFNDALCECPLVFADESLPNTRTISEDLRELIGSTTRSLHRKFMPSSSLSGAVRLIICGNNPDMLRPSNDMTEFDLDAVAERFLPLEAPVAAANYLKEIGGPAVVNTWITEDKLAKHALWLAQTREVKSNNSRFLVVGQKDRFHERLAVNSGVGAAVCEVLVQLLNSKTKMLPQLKELVLVGEGKLLVNVNALKLLWETYMQHMPMPGTQKLSKALAAISTKLNPIRVNGEQRRYSMVRIDQLLSWADESGMAQKETLLEKLNVPNELLTGKQFTK